MVPRSSEEEQRTHWHLTSKLLGFQTVAITLAPEVVVLRQVSLDLVSWLQKGVVPMF